MPAPLNVNREEVKMLALAIGLRPAARKLGIPIGTLSYWSTEGNWFAKPEHVQPPTVKPVQTLQTKPSEALQSVLNDNSARSKLGFSKASTKVAEHLAEQPAKKLMEPGTAQSAKAWVGVAAQSMGWQDQQQNNSSCLVNLNLLIQ